MRQGPDPRIAADREAADRLLDRIGILTDPCDLDLLVFFARHPRSLLSTESLRSFLGYDLNAIAESLDTLLTAGLLTQTQTSIHAARLYVLPSQGATRHGWLPALLTFASTREGRLALRGALSLRERGSAAENKL